MSQISENPDGFIISCYRTLLRSCLMSIWCQIYFNSLQTLAITGFIYPDSSSSGTFREGLTSLSVLITWCPSVSKIEAFRLHVIVRHVTWTSGNPCVKSSKSSIFKYQDGDFICLWNGYPKSATYITKILFSIFWMTSFFLSSVQSA